MSQQGNEWYSWPRRYSTFYPCIWRIPESLQSIGESRNKAHFIHQIKYGNYCQKRNVETYGETNVKSCNKAQNPQSRTQKLHHWRQYTILEGYTSKPSYRRMIRRSRSWIHWYIQEDRIRPWNHLSWSIQQMYSFPCPLFYIARKTDMQLLAQETLCNIALKFQYW